MSVKRKSLVRTLDKVFSDYIRERDHHRCVTCGSVKSIQCGHLFSRVAYSTRWNPRNAYAQCVGCNMRHEHDPFALTFYFLGRFGAPAYEELHRAHRAIGKYSDAMLEEMIEHFRNQRASMLLAKTY